jgi:hypothetical protein
MSSPADKRKGKTALPLFRSSKVKMEKKKKKRKRKVTEGPAEGHTRH